jgi:hypothetical protein
MSDPVQFHETVSAIVWRDRTARLVVSTRGRKCRGLDKHYASVHIGITARPGGSGDLADFADGGAELYLFDTRKV